MKITIKSRVEDKVKYFFAKNMQGETFGFWLEEPYRGKISFNKDLELIDWKFYSLESLRKSLEEYKKEYRIENPENKLVKIIKLDEYIYIYETWEKFSIDDAQKHYVVIRRGSQDIALHYRDTPYYKTKVGYGWNDNPKTFAFKTIEEALELVKEYKKEIYQNERLINFFQL
jgi:hypothetical protein